MRMVKQKGQLASFLLHLVILECLPFRTCSLLFSTAKTATAKIGSTITTITSSGEGECLQLNLHQTWSGSRSWQGLDIPPRHSTSVIIQQRGGATGTGTSTAIAVLGGGGGAASNYHHVYKHRHDNNKNRGDHDNNQMSSLRCPQEQGEEETCHPLGLKIRHQMLQSLSFGKILVTNIQTQYAQRIAADPNFLQKSVTEVILAAGTQFMAEIGKRGIHQIVTEIDFVIAGILTAIAGKYYSMWRVAPTCKISIKEEEEEDNTNKCTSTSMNVVDTNSQRLREEQSWDVPTNAFQTNRPYTLPQRFMSFIVPVPSLFQAGVIASAIGYGFTSFLIFLRSILFPDYVAATVNVNTFHACLYTGAFMAIVSNVRYQLLQGIIEPYLVDRLFGKLPFLRACMTFAVRLANGLLGSFLAIAGMKMMGLQKLKSYE
jgi:Domain of unknown function (DUF3411).